ncbi:MAG: hypothetical protein RLZ57_1025 [Actinomycetota bacterium]|jgi:transporter family-2 protein
MRLDYLAALAGIFIALQGRANGELDKFLASSVQTALISFSVGLIAISLYGLGHRESRAGLTRLRIALKEKVIPYWGITGGLLGGTFITMQSYLVPKVGVAILSVGYIGGQTVCSLFIDQIGLTGGGKKAISPARIWAGTITIIAVLVSVFDRLNSASLTLFFVVLSIFSGGIVALHRALNGRINEITLQSSATTIVNFIMGTTFLAMIFLFLLLTNSTTWSPLPEKPLWIYTGGITGVLYIAFSAKVVQHIGVLHFTLFSVGGQLVGSLLLDWLLPTTTDGISLFLIFGILLTFLGVIVGGASNSPTPKSATPK